MRKTVLALASLLFAGTAAHAQWVQQPFTFANPALSAFYIDAVDANVVWSAGFDLANDAGGKQVAFSTNGGTTWTVSTITTLTSAEEITGIAGISATTALVCTSYGPAGGGRILKTTNGGTTWAAQTVTGQFTNAASFPNYIAFFNATEGVCAGDPVGGRFEVYRTTDAGTTWTAVATANLPVALSNEFSVVNHFATVGNGFWFSTTFGRVFGTADKGVTWTVGDTNLGAMNIPWVSFRDASNGLALTAAGALARTTNGGTTWTSVTPSGTIHGGGIDNVPGTNQYVSIGNDIDPGSSYSRDNGATWVVIENARNHGSVDFVSSTVGWSSALNASSGGLGAYKLSTAVLGTTQNVALQQGLSAYPNPSADGQFTVAMAQGRPAEAQVTVCDALGRRVYTRTVATAAAPTFTIDLSRQTPGVYTMQLRTEGGVAQQQLVVQ